MAKLKKITIALLSVLALGTLLYPGVSGLRQMDRYSPAEALEYIDGRYVENVRTGFEKSIPTRDEAVSFWSLLKFRLFHEGSSGVLIGENDWLYTTEEYDENLNGEMDYETFSSKVEEVSRHFQNEGITLAVVLVPSKSRIYKNRIPRFEPSETIDSRYNEALKFFSSLAIPTVDLKSAFEQSEDQNSLFYRYDTHWTYTGSSVAANAIATEIQPYMEKYNLSRRSYSIYKQMKTAFKGDLLSYVPALRSSIEKKKQWETFLELELIDSDPPEIGLFDDPEIPVILVGTSYSFDDRWNFENSLKLALQLDVLNMAKEGQGPIGPMEELIESQYYRDMGSSIVLWEIPERYIPLR